MKTIHDRLDEIANELKTCTDPHKRAALKIDFAKLIAQLAQILALIGPFFAHPTP